MNKKVITKQEQDTFTKELKGYGFKDQPSGNCSMCKWDDGTQKRFYCQIPQAYVTNLICIQKLMLVSINNIENSYDD